jgi:hypothetical protein
VQQQQQQQQLQRNGDRDEDEEPKRGTQFYEFYRDSGPVFNVGERETKYVNRKN